MIDAEHFLEQQGLRPVSADVGGPASMSKPKGDCRDSRRTLFAGSADTLGVSGVSRHAKRVGSGASNVTAGMSDLDACREAALRLLDAAPRPSGALRERLIGKGYTPEVVDDVIERLKRVQLLDDEAYAQSAVRACAARLMGRRGAVMELVRKGVERSLAQQVCDEAERQGVFADAAWELGRRTAHKTAGLDRDVRRRRLWSAGGRKGHDPEILREIAQELFD